MGGQQWAKGSHTEKVNMICFVPSYFSTVDDATVVPTMKAVHALLSRIGMPL